MRLILAIPHDSYENIQNTLGLLECVKAEYYRRVAVPYEETKKHENGDLKWEYKHGR